MEIKQMGSGQRGQQLCRRCGLIPASRRDGLCWDCWDKKTTEEIEFLRGYEEWERMRKERERNEEQRD